MTKTIIIITLLTTLAAFPGCNPIDPAYMKEIEQFQKDLNDHFADPENSPLKPADRLTFESLDFFPVDPSFCVSAKIIRTPDAKAFEMETSTERRPVYVKYGDAFFSLDNKMYKLGLYFELAKMPGNHIPEYLFLPFTDETNGLESYGGGRYIDLPVPESDTITIDFNKAYNPYCAYSDMYSCPVPPSENDLDTEIRAGVMAYGNGH